MGLPFLVGLGGAGICDEWAGDQTPICEDADESAADFIYTVEYENQAFNPGGGNPIGGTGSGVTYWPARDTFLLVDNDNACIHEFNAQTKAWIRIINLLDFGDVEEIHWIDDNTFALSTEFNTGSLNSFFVVVLDDSDIDATVDAGGAIRHITITNILTSGNRGIEAFAYVGGYFYFTTEEASLTPAEWHMWRVANEGTGPVFVAAEDLFDITPLIGGSLDTSGMAADEDGMLWLISATSNTISQITPSGQLLRTVPINSFEDETAFTQAEGIEIFRNADGLLRLAITGEDPAGVDMMILTPPGIPGPTGPKGVSGGAGRDGLDAFTTTGGTFIVPDVDGTGTLLVANSEMFAVNQPVFVEGAGYFKIVQVPSTTQLRVMNYGAPYTQLPNSAIVAPKKVIGAGTPGPNGETPPGLATAWLVHRTAEGIGGGHVEWPVSPVQAYKGIFAGPLTEVYDQSGIVAPVTDVCLDNTEPFASARVPLAFILQPGKYSITVRFVGFGVREYQGRMRVGLIDNESPRNLIGGDAFRSTCGYTDNGATIQTAVTRTLRVGRGIPVCVWFALTAAFKPSGGNLEFALGRPCSFSGEDEMYLTVKIQQLERA